MKTLTLLLAALTVLACPVLAQKLDSKISRRITTISTSLDHLDKSVASKNLKAAESDLKAAEKEMAKILSWYKGKFDESHPDFVAIKKRLAASKASVLGIAGATGQPGIKPKPATPTATGTTSGSGGGGKALDSKVAKRILAIARNLDDLDKSVQAQNLEQAQRDLANAEKEMGKITSWYKGKFDESHPDFVAIKKRLAEGKTSLQGESGLAARAESTGQALNAVLATMKENQQALNQGINAVRKGITSFNSVMGNSGDRDGDKQIDAAIADIRNSVERTLLVHAIAMQTAADFEKQYPDVRVLKNLVKNTLDAEWALRGLKSFPEAWERIRLSFLQNSLHRARSGNKDSKAAIERGLSDSDFMDHALSSAKGSVVYGERIRDFTGALLGSEDIPGGPNDKTMAALRESQKELVSEVDQLSVMIAKAEKTFSDLKTMKLAKARFHETQYKGGKWKQVCQEMSQAFETDTKNKKVHRIVVHSPWDQRTEACWRSNRWIVGTYRYVGGTVLAKLPDGRYRVYRMSFRRTQQADGSFGPIQVFGFGHSYEILAENKDK